MVLINKQSVFNSRELCTAIIIRCFENSKKRKFISSKFRKQGNFVISKFRKNSHNFAAFSSKYRIERREIPPEISPTYRRKFARTIHEIRRNSLSLLLHSTVLTYFTCIHICEKDIASVTDSKTVRSTADTCTIMDDLHRRCLAVS